MTQAKRSRSSEPSTSQRAVAGSYVRFVADISQLLEHARQQAARSVNSILTATYWEIGRRIVEYDQSGQNRAAYGTDLLNRLSADLTKQFGRGFSVDNLETMRLFYRAYPAAQISETASRKSRISGTTSRNSQELTEQFKLSWSHYVLLIKRVRSCEARAFYEAEARCGGWSVRQLERQIDSQFYERTSLSRDKTAVLRKGRQINPGGLPVEGEFRDPFVLEFLGLKDEYSESDLEDGLVRHLETFLLELGRDFTFVARQKRLRVGDEWYRVDLVFYHRGLRCLVLIDLKLGRFTHADAGQMHMYLNYAREHWTRADENPPVGLILCAYKDNAVAHYALNGLSNKLLAAEYRTSLPEESEIAGELERTRRRIEGTWPPRKPDKRRQRQQKSR